jgi:excinuclease ABC subunit C
VVDPALYRPASGSIPDQPGVYRFRDETQQVIYVGKAKSLRSRLNSYFADVAGLHPRTQSMVQTAASVDWVTVGTEVEALQLEYTWIKEFDPRFNVRYRDDKSYPYLVVTWGEEFPRAFVSRDAKRKGARYFGPYPHAWAIRDTLDLILRVFPIRTCSAGVFKRAAHVGRPCLLGYIDKCSAPCVGRVSAEEHRELVSDFLAFMSGRTNEIERRLRKAMEQAAADEDFESAARFRDDLGALRRATERNAVVLPDGTEADVIGISEDELEAAVEIFHVREGRIRGQRSLVVEKVEDISTTGLMTRLLQEIYMDAESVPRQVLMAVEPEEGMAELLSSVRGSTVSVLVPQRGTKRALLGTVEGNAQQTLMMHKIRRAGDLTTRSLALSDIQGMLGLEKAPLRIECIDISHFAGEGVVGALVVFEDGVPKNRDYRSYTISDEGARDDTSAIYEVVSRRFRPVTDDAEPTGPRRSAYAPSLLVIDGGAPQVAAAKRALDDREIVDLPVIGLAKRLEEVWVAGESEPVILPRSSEGLYLLQRIRDEAHRSALRHQKKTRRKKISTSVLDTVPGLGPTRHKDLLKRFGSIKRIRAASLAELQEVPGIGPQLASSIHEHLNSTEASTLDRADAADTTKSVDTQESGPGTMESGSIGPGNSEVRSAVREDPPRGVDD